MRISDWSSDVCSSDLRGGIGPLEPSAIWRSGGGNAVRHGGAFRLYAAAFRAYPGRSAAAGRRLAARAVASAPVDQRHGGGHRPARLHAALPEPGGHERLSPVAPDEIGRAHVCTPVTHAHLVFRLLLEKKN